jgi:FtsZ-interacting cell division protein ZipA
VDKDLFRLILLGLGVALVLAVYYWDRLRKLFSRRSTAAATQPRATPDVAEAGDEGLDEGEYVGTPRPVSRREPVIDDETPDILASELEALIRSDEPADVLLEEPPPREAARDEPAPAESPTEPAPVVLAVTLVSASGSISGIRLRRVLTDHGLGLGSRGLFERIGEEGRALYSAANLVEPGLFDPLTLDGLTTPGLMLFQVLEGPGDHLETFEAMLDVGRRLAERLDCTLCDTRRTPLNDTTLAALRDEAARAGQ